jgi:diguanylate cyclase (GGDEF)-like protein
VATPVAALSTEELELRAERRLTMAYLIGGNCFINSVILLFYAIADVTTPSVVVAYGLVATGLIASYLTLSKSGLNNHFDDHYLAFPTVLATAAVDLAFFKIAPEAAPVFITDTFIVFGFSALRLNVMQATTALVLVTLGFAMIAATNVHSLVSPTVTPVQKLISLICYISALGRCLVLGLHGNALRMRLHERTMQLKAALNRIEQFAELDELTGIMNRRTIMRALDDELARSQRTGRPCSIALIDLDHFKRVNDVFGHPTGDEVLRTFAITVFANIRSIDKFGRYGGEEFLLILPETSQTAAEALLARLCELIETLDWSGITPTMVTTISAGFAEIRPEDNSDSVLARCDRALYRAKDAGRNCVVTSP